MRHIFYGMVTALLAWFDLYVKRFVEKEVKDGEEELVCKDKVVIRKVYNKGFALNTLEEKPAVVKWISLGVCGIIAGYVCNVWKTSTCFVKNIAASLVLAGGISNTYERIKKSYVVDYFGFRTKNKKFNRVTFNLGDMFIFLGGIVLMISELIKEKH